MIIKKEINVKEIKEELENTLEECCGGVMGVRIRYSVANELIDILNEVIEREKENK